MRICKIAGCGNRYYCKEYCLKHYTRWYRYGDPFLLKNEKHGMSKSAEYITWFSMKARCYNKNDTAYHRYGARGITVCERWRNSFIAFLKDMGPKPFSRAQIDRIDNNGNYESENCRWTTAKENMRNSSTVKLTMDKAKKIRKKYIVGKILQRELAVMFGVTRQTIGDVMSNKTWK